MVDAEIELLGTRGVEVVPFIKESDDISLSRGVMAEAAVGPLYSPSGVRGFRQTLEHHQPDVVHIHNVFPLISPWVVKVARTHGVPVVQTVHNYRHSCVNGLHFRDGHVCVDCISTRTNWPAVAHGCYRGSRAQSAPMALSQVVHKGLWVRGVTRYIALTDFMRSRLEIAGIPRSSISVRPTWVPDPGIQPPGTSHALFVGRLDENKGLRLLLHAWSRRSHDIFKNLHIVGSGPLEPLVRSVADADASVIHHGGRPKEYVNDLMRRCGVVVVPSIWFEGYPLVIAEAFAHGRPVITLAGGSAATTVNTQTGWVCEASWQALAETFSMISQNDLNTRGANARQHFEGHNSPEASFELLMDIYSAAVGQSQSDGS
jgi:glycosyltransferase involved in cell wall biosynthesis